MAGLGIVITMSRRKGTPVAAPVPLDQAERAALARILGPNEAPDTGDDDGGENGENGGGGEAGPLSGPPGTGWPGGGTA